MVFQPGKSGNPTGKTKDKIWRDALSYEANQLDKDTGEKQIAKAARELMKKCLAGDVAALKEFGDRLDGKPPQEQQIDINETKTVIRAPSVSTPETWIQKPLTASNTTSTGNPSPGHKLNS